METYMCTVNGAACKFDGFREHPQTCRLLQLLCTYPSL